MQPTAPSPRERPILFSAPMVRAILKGRKTQTRRLVGLDTLQRSHTHGYDWTWRGQAPVRSIEQQRRHPGGCWQDVSNARLLSLCPHGAPGDRLWIKETWRVPPGHFDLMSPREIRRHTPVRYEADGVVLGGTDLFVDAKGLISIGGRVRQSIFMPRWASRITLEVASVRVERLQDISEEDAKAEGVLPFGEAYACFSPEQPIPCGDGRPSFAAGDRPFAASYAVLWDEINADRAPWASNPWVWRIEFARVEAVHE